LNNPKTETDQFRTTKKVKERQKALENISKQKKKKIAKSIAQRTIEALLWFFPIPMHLMMYSMYGYNIIPEQGPPAYSRAIFALSIFIGTVFVSIHEYFLTPLLNRIQPIDYDYTSIIFECIGALLSAILYAFYIYSHF